MAAASVTLDGIIYDKLEKSARNVCIIGMAHLTDLHVDAKPPEFIPLPPGVDPPAPPTDTTKPPPADGGWGYHPDYGWGYFPGTGGVPGPKESKK